MTSDGLGEMFEGDSADTCARKFSLTSMGGWAESVACADPGARTPIGVSGNFVLQSKGFVWVWKWLYSLSIRTEKIPVPHSQSKGKFKLNIESYKLVWLFLSQRMYFWLPKKQIMRMTNTQTSWGWAVPSSVQVALAKPAVVSYVNFFLASYASWFVISYASLLPW
jgi:hypothetical protein